MIEELKTKIEYLKSENTLLKSQIRKKNAIIKKYSKQIKLLECGIDPANFEGTQLTIYDFLRS